DKGRAGMSSTFLTRLRVGSKLVDAKGVSRLYRQRISTFQLALLALAGLAALAVALWATPGGQALVQILGARLDGMLSWFTTLFAPRPSGSEEGTENVIDFRYHLVSLISVFLALAVGIVLGAGPLRENLGDQLAGQVEQLRTEQDQLRSQADELGIQNDQLASFITEIGPDLVADTLPGNDIAILTDDSSTRPATERTSELLEEAGAQSVTRVDLQPALWEPDEDDRRTEAISAISAIAPGALDTELEGSEQLSAVIVTLLAPAAEDSDLDPELRAQIWQILVDHQLVTLTGDMPPQVDGVIFASAAPEDLAEESEDDTAATERAQGLLASQTALVDQLAVADLPAVGAGATPHNDATTSPLRTRRGRSGGPRGVVGGRHGRDRTGAGPADFPDRAGRPAGGLWPARGGGRSHTPRRFHPEPVAHRPGRQRAGGPVDHRSARGGRRT